MEPSEGSNDSRSDTPIKLHHLTLLAIVTTTTYSACSDGKDDPGPDVASGGAHAGSGGAGDAGGGVVANGGVTAANGGDGAESGGEGLAGGVGGSAGAAGKGSGGRVNSGGTAGAAGEDAGASAVGGNGSGGGLSLNVDTIDAFAFYRPALISGADGVLHMAFNTNTSPSEMYYARCSTDCGEAGNWTLTVVGMHAFSGQARLVVGSDNRLHLLYDSAPSNSDPQRLIYATCASQCSNAGRWTSTDLGPLFGGWNSPSYGSPLVIDAENRLSFTVDRKIYLNGGVSLATCASGCTSVNNWSVGTISATGTQTSLAVEGTTLHQLIDNAAGNGTGNALSYRRCEADCTEASNWQELPNLFAFDGGMPNALVVTADGRVRIAYNQGASDSSQSTEVKAQDQRLLVWGCDADCLEASSWTGFISGEAGDGAKGIALAELNGALVLAVSNDDRILGRYCADDCLVDSNWTEVELDSAEAVSAEYDPLLYSGRTCSGLPPLFATWHLAQGVTAITPDGSAAFAHAASLLQTCAGSTSVTYLPGFGRVVYVE